MLTFYIVRHGNKESVPFDPKLTEAGIQQAEHTAKFFQNIPLKKIVASPKTRTQQTAKIINSLHSLEIVSDERLRERLEWENDRTFEQFWEEWDRTDLDRNLTPSKGLSANANGARSKQFLDELSEDITDGNILIVTHGGTIGDLLRNIFPEELMSYKVSTSGAKYIHVSECSITTITKQNGTYSLVSCADISHL